MTSFRAFVLAAASILLISSWTGPARATLMWEFGFNGRLNNFEGTGSFTLGGSTTADGLVAFEFSGVCGTAQVGDDNICDFDINDVIASSWTLSGDWTFDDLMMRARSSVMSSTGSWFFDLSFERSFVRLTCRDVNVREDRNLFRYFDVRGDSIGGGAFLRPIHIVSEPPTRWLFSLGLLALAAAVLWVRRQRPSGESLSGV